MRQIRRHSLGMLGFFLLTIASFLIATDIDAATGINQQISFQGKVVNANGTNVANGSYTFVFSLYTVSSGGSNIWTESKSVTVTDGIFQTNLGDATALPGSVDFNTDNIYLGINFNADGEMSPRVRFTAAPYAFNAQKVGGLTVTDTTGTLTIPNSETISFGGSFSTTASNDVALTTSGATTLTLPTTGTLATLAGTEVLTNKSIGSTGLTFSGATTDITTASGESLVIVANGAGVVDIQDATTVDSLTADTGGVSIAAGQSYTGAGAVTVSSATTNALTIDSGTTGTVNLGTGNNAKTVAIATGTAGNTVNIGTDNTTSDTINIGSALDNVAITGDQWSITNAGVLTVVSCTGCAGGSTLTVRESDGSPSVASTGTLEFGPASTSSEEFIVTDQTGGVARVVAGTMIGKLNEAETVTAGWTFNTVATTFTTAINANGGLTTTTTDQNLSFSANGAGDFVFAVDSGTIVSLTGGADGTSALTIAAGDLTLTDGDLIVTAGDANFTLDAADTLNVSKTGANAGDVANITASSVNAIDGLQIALASTADAAGDAVSGLDIAWTESTDGDTWTAINLPNTTSTNSTTRGLVIGTGYDTGISVASGGISATGTIAFPTLSTNGFVKTTGGTGTLSVSTDVALTTDTTGNYVANANTSVLTGLTGGSAGSEGATLSLAFDYSQALSGDVGLAANAAVFGQSGLVFEGSAADTSETYLAVTNATADRTQTFQDNSGVIPLGTAGNTLFFTTSGATNVTLPTSGTLISQAYATVQDEASGLTQRATLNFTGAGVSCVDNSGSSRTDCTIAGGGSTAWDAIGDPSGAGAIAFGSTAQTLDWATMDANASYFSFNFTNGGTSAGTDNGVVINNVLSNATPTDSITENLLLIQQLDTTGGNTILVSNALGIDAAGNSGITNAINITNSAGDITNGINIADTAGGTITDGILVSGTLTNILNTPSIDISGTGVITGATGITSSGSITFSGLTANSFLYSGTGGLLTTTTAPTNGQLLIGSTGAAPVAATLTGTANEIAVTNGAGSITLGVPDDGLDFTEFQDTLDLDAALTLNQTTNTWSQTFTGTTTTGFSYTADSLTSGKGLSIASATVGLTSAGSLADITLSGSNAANAGSLLSLQNTGTLNTGTTLLVQHNATGTNNLAMRVNDVAGDTTPFVIDGTGNVGIGVSAPGYPLDVVSNASGQSANFARGVGIGVAPSTNTDIPFKVMGQFATNTYFIAPDTGSAATINLQQGDGDTTGSLTATATTRDFTIASVAADIVLSPAATFGVGIGDTSPDNPFEIVSTSPQVRLSYTDGSVDGLVYVNSSEYLMLQAGATSEINRVQIGAGGAGATTPDLFGLDVKSDTGDPAGGFEGAMYYNTLDNVFRCYQNTGWTNCIGSGGSLTVRESDAAPSVASTTTLEFGPASTSSEEFIVTDQTGGVARVIIGTQVAKLNEAETVTGGWTFNTAGTTFATAVAANGGITFDAATDTVGAFTAAGTINMSANILENIGNTGTDFVASTGALTLAGVLTANGGITLASSQTFTASSLSYMDLGAITHGTTAVQGLRLPQAASASPSSPSSGEGYLAWDAGGNQVIYYNGSAWATFGAGGGYATIKDESTSLTQRTTLAFLGAGVSCADNVTQTECTISGGSGSDLQGAYGADADGSNATISLTAADDGLIFTNPTSGGNDLSAFLLQLTQQNTTAGIVVLDMVQSSNAANGASLVANAIDGETGLVITTNGLTSGKGINVTSSATAFTGNLADISLTGSNAANTGNVLAVSNTGTANTNTTLFVDHRATGTGNLAVRVDDVSGDTTPFIIDGDGRVGIGTSSISSAAATERLLQVGSETNRGNMATYGEVISKGLRRHTALAGIKDVFVYDTTSDSDGGRWIDWSTTDKLSWYSEALDDGPSDPCDLANDDRCYKASFPRKAILIVTTSALYILDAATNDMWMKFNQNASGYALGVDTNNDPSSVTAMNGVIYVGANGTSAGGLYAIDFVNDRMWNYNGTNRSAADRGISQRNEALSYNVDPDAKLEISPVGTAAEWERVNDVAVQTMTHTESAVTALGATPTTNSGQGKTFVALATDSGVTVINLSDRLLNQYSDVTADDYTSVALNRRGFLYALNTTQDQLERWDTIDTDKASEVNGTFTRKWDETYGTGPALSTAAFNIVAGMPDNLEIAERASYALEGQDVIYVGHSLGLAELHDHTTQINGWVKWFNQTRQSPMMPLAGVNNDVVLPMDDTSGTQAQDITLTNTDMAIVGSPTLGVNGVQGRAINFDNSNDYLCSDADQNNACDVDAAFNMSTVGWTISVWFRHSATAPASGADTIFEKCVTAVPAKATGCVIAYMTTTGTVVVANDTDATWTRPDEGAASYNITSTSTYAYNDNQWHHLLIHRTNINDVDTWIDAQPLNLSTATGGTTTFDGSQIVTLGASCVLTVTANCGAVTNVWDGQLDDFQFIVGTTTQASFTHQWARRLYNAERPRAVKKTLSVTDATSATSTSLTDTGEAWFVNELAGLVVEITGSSDTDCVGLTRRIVSNTATSLTFTPAVPGACTLDTSADFQVDPEALYGGTDSIAGIGLTAESPLGEARQLCVGTNSGSDTGGVTCYNHQAGPSIVADVYHSQASQLDDSGTDWTGSNYDEITSIDLSSRSLIMGSEAHFTSVTEDVRLGQGLDYIANQLYMIRQEIVLDGITTVGSTAMEVGYTGGADLAERYYSNEPLQAGEVVAIDSSLEAGVKKTTSRYQRDTLGIVATQPGIVLGTEAENGYPIALVGRVPVKVTNENGPIYVGDRLTAASRSGYAMRATQAGRVIGQTLGDAVDWAVCEGEDPMNHDAVLCTTVTVFVNLSDYYGQPVELAMAERDAATEAAALETATGDEEVGLTSDGASVRLTTAAPTREEKLLAFLREIRDERAKTTAAPSEVFTDRVAASSEVITPRLIADEIWAKSIKADSIEGLAIYTNRIASLEAKYAGLAPDAEPFAGDVEITKEKTFLNLEQFQVGSISVAFDANVLGKLSVTGALRVIDAAEFQGETTFASLVSFLSDAVFRGKVAFETAPTFGADTAGFATIEKGRKKVRVNFTEAYEKQPIVTVALTRDISPLLDGGADADLRADVAAVEKDFAETLFEAGIQYLVTEKDQTGFTILLSKDAPTDLSFSWVAIAVRGARTFESGKAEEVRTEESIETPVETLPTPTPPPVTNPVEETPPVVDPPVVTEPTPATEIPVPATT